MPSCRLLSDMLPGVLWLLAAAGTCSCGEGSGNPPSGGGSSGAGGATMSSGTGGDATTGGGGGTGGLGASSGSGGTGGLGASGGSGGNAGNGGTGGTAATGADACPGDAYLLAPRDSLALAGTTAGAADDHTSFCGDTSMASDAGDLVYAFTFDQAGTVKLSVSAVGANLKPAVYFRGDCAADELCYPSTNGVAKLAKAVEAGTYHVIVDGAPGTAGEFELSISFDVARCGDGVINPGEECDPGVTSADDGCGDPDQPDACMFQPAPPEHDDCPGEVVSIPPGITILQGWTYGYLDDHNSKPGGGCPNVGGGRDRVYKLVPEQNGQKMVVQIGLGADGVTDACSEDVSSPACWDWKLYARSTCSDASTELACSDEGALTPEIIVLDNVVANSAYHVFVDGFDASSYSYGPFHLKIVLLQ